MTVPPGTFTIARFVAKQGAKRAGRELAKRALQDELDGFEVGNILPQGVDSVDNIGNLDF